MTDDDMGQQYFKETDESDEFSEEELQHEGGFADDDCDGDGDDDQNADKAAISLAEYIGKLDEGTQKSSKKRKHNDNLNEVNEAYEENEFSVTTNTGGTTQGESLENNLLETVRT